MPIASNRSRLVFQKLERDLIKLSSKPRAESVHRFRTGTRRLQILLGELSPKLDRSEKKLLKLLGRIRKRAGKVRDLDVQLAALRSLKVPHEPRRKTQLVNHLIELRRQQEKKLRQEADKATVREIRKRLKRAARRFKPEASRDPLAAARAMLSPLDRTSSPPTEAVLHQYRILSKRARYAAEFASPSPEAEKFIAELKVLQDALGDWHDWLTLRQTAIENIGEVRESPLVAELHNVTGAKFRHAVAVLSRTRGELTTTSEHAARAPLPAALKPRSDTASAA
ncbi:MAG TPA: CHAD domain-containing protein [Terriglobales bacterium]|nr:CHAD domain-containing protein [Terriglobales bacterium]